MHHLILVRMNHLILLRRRHLILAIVFAAMVKRYNEHDVPTTKLSHADIHGEKIFNKKKLKDLIDKFTLVDF
mgnify:CR=1 FL=1